MTAVPAHVEQGDGPPLVFLHGIGGNAHSFDDQLPHFASRYRAIAWDMPGYGGSALTEEMTFPMLARSLQALLVALKIERPILVGHSMGGMVAQEFAARHPDRLRALILAGTSPAFGKPGGDWQRQFLNARLAPLDAGQTPADFADRLVDSMFGDDKDLSRMDRAAESMRQLSADSYRAALHCIVTFNQLDNLPRIAVPTLCLAAERDGNAAPGVMEKMAAKIPGARFHCMAGAGHLMNIEAPAAFNATLDDFLDILQPDTVT